MILSFAIARPSGIARATILGCWLLSLAGGAGAFELSGDLTLELRAFLEGRGASGQAAESTSLALTPEIYHDWDDGRQSLRMTLFGRLDGTDEARSHADVRELYWQFAARSWELSVGWKRIFWGVTESAQVVDIINQTDLVEDLDGEQKLGQSMVHLAIIQPWGTVDLFALPRFRERRFAGFQGRLRTIPVVDPSLTQYASSRGEEHLDWAIRWSHSFGIFDLGLHHFAGTDRAPRLIPVTTDDGRDVLQPFYPTIRQFGVDLQATQGPLLLKLEAVDVRDDIDPYTRVVVGFEYTFFDVAGRGVDVGALAEYASDERLGRPETVFLGTRWAFNDVQSTEFLAGAIVSDEDGTLWTVEGSRRLGDAWRLNMRARGFTNVSEDSPLLGLRQDDYLEIEISRFF